MVMPAADFAVASMVSTIPVIVTGKILMDFTERAFPDNVQRRSSIKRATYRKPRSVRKARRSNLGIVGFGNFSNVGY